MQFVPPGIRDDSLEQNGDMSVPFQLSESNINMMDLGGDPSEFRYFYSGDSISENSSPSTSNSNNIQVSGIEGYGKDADSQFTGPVSGTKFKKTKKQLLEEQDAILLSRDDSTLSEEELQMKKKAQNRAAQRAFRERKENKLKTLENQLNKSKADQEALLKELELIRRKNLDMQTENEQLRKRSAGSVGATQAATNFDFPKSENEFVHSILYGNSHHQFDPVNAKKVYDSPDNGEKVLALGAVWDYLLYRAEEDKLNLDVVEVMNKLKGNEKCHGYGPAYPVALVDKVIEECS